VGESRVTRREFLKLLGYGTFAIGFGSLLRFTNLPNVMKDFNQYSSAQTSGSWALGTATTCVAIHSAILPNGKVFYLAGSGYHRDRPTGPFEARLYDPVTNTEKDLPLSEDLFCLGLTSLPDGNILMAGGTLMYDTNPDNCNGEWHGLSSAFELDINSESLVKVSSMSHGRWYPTAVTLPDGRTFVLGGLDEYGANNFLVEIYDPTSRTWSISYNPNAGNTYCVGIGGNIGLCPGAGSPCYGSANNGVAPAAGGYPRMHLMPSGLVAFVGGTNVFRTWNPANGSWSSPITQNRTARSYGTSFLLPLNNNSSERGKVLVCGGSAGTTTPTNPGISAVEILDFDAGSNTNPVVRSVASITYGRRYLTPVILPTGKLAIFGGTAFAANNSPVYVPEIFDPVTETWQTLPAASVPRVYHQSAVLLTDGRVRTQGGTPGSGNQELRTEIFSPDYVFSGSRPVISNAPIVGDYGGTIAISTPDPTSIQRVSLVRLMATTHHYDANQRLIWLQIVSTGSNTLTVSAPINANIAPPGYYMIFILNASGIPSVSKVIKIPGTGGGGGDTTPPAQVTGLAVTPISNTQLNLSWTANTEPDLDHYNVYRGTTPGFAVTLGTTTPVGVPTTNSFSDIGLTGSTTYYYKVSAVDHAGNIGPLSVESSGTTASVNPVFYDVAVPGDGFGTLEPGNSVRFGEEANTVTSLLVGKSLKTWKLRLRKRASPSGNITAKIRRRSDDAIMATFNETINSATLDASFAEHTFTLTTPYTIQVGDRIMVEYGGPSGVEVEVWLSDKFDGANTRRVRYTTTYGTSNTADLTGSMSSAVAGGDTTPPAQVTGLAVTPVSDTQLNLSWTANTEPDLGHYNVYRGTTPGFAVTLGTTTPVGQPTTNSFSNTGLTSSTTYYYKVSAVDATGNIGPLSTESSGTTSSVNPAFYNVPVPADGFGTLEPGNSVRFGEEANTVTSLLVGKSLKTWKVRLRKRRTPSGNVIANVRRRSDDSVVATFNETINSATLGTAFAEYTFTLTTPYTIAVGDRIMIEYSGPSGVEMETWLSDKFDGANTRRIRYITTYATSNTADISGSMSSS
jgi:Domain of unknown function (DUF1929)